MNDNQLAAFQQGSGLSVDWLHWFIELVIGGVAIALGVCLLICLMRMLESRDLAEKARFKLYLFGIGFFLSTLFLIVFQ